MRDVDHVEEPSIVMLGAGGWDNRPYDEGTPCPVCGRGIICGDDNVYCARCDSASPAVEARLVKARVGVKARDRREEAGRKLEASLRKLARTTLSESDRRKIWNGYKNGIMQESEDVTNLAAEGRAFLIREGQCPDWSLTLVKRSWRQAEAG